MRKISTGEPSNLKTYRNIAIIISGGEDTKAVKFLDKRIAESPRGENEEVLADESQMIYLIMKLTQEELKEK